MDIKQVIKRNKSDFNNTLVLVGVIPLLVFVYILVGKVANFKIMLGEVGYIVLATIGVFATGIIVGRKMLMSVTMKLIDDNQRILSMQQELVEEKSKAAITETALTLGDQINNPLLAIRGNLDLLDLDLKALERSDDIKKKLATIRSNCERIREVTSQISHLTKPESSVIHGGLRMVDLNKSV
jgi:signal transduction histidine kinase